MFPVHGADYSLQSVADPDDKLPEHKSAALVLGLLKVACQGYCFDTFWVSTLRLHLEPCLIRKRRTVVMLLPVARKTARAREVLAESHLNGAQLSYGKYFQHPSKDLSVPFLAHPR